MKILEGNNNNYLEYLAYQINVMNENEYIVKKFPAFETEINDKNSKIKEMIEEFDDIRHRDTYTQLVQEFTDILEKNK